MPTWGVPPQGKGTTADFGYTSAECGEATRSNRKSECGPGRAAEIAQGQGGMFCAGGGGLPALQCARGQSRPSPHDDTHERLSVHKPHLVVSPAKPFENPQCVSGDKRAGGRKGRGARLIQAAAGGEGLTPRICPPWQGGRKRTSTAIISAERLAGARRGRGRRGREAGPEQLARVPRKTRGPV